MSYQIFIKLVTFPDENFRCNCTLFLDKLYKEWHLIECLEFLESKCAVLTSSDQQHIQDEFKAQLLVLMRHQSLSKSARSKASMLYDSMSQLFMLEEVSTFFQR